MGAELASGQWVDPSAGDVPLGEWAQHWMDSKPRLKQTTQQLYDWVLAKYVLPYLAHVPIGQITPALVRTWYAEISRIGAKTPVRQAYSLLRAMLATATDDEILMRNPCTLRGISTPAPERPIATLQQVLALADAVPAHYRALILTATWSSARWSELVGLTRDRLDLAHGRMRIDRQLVELRGCQLAFQTPKSGAGIRTVHLPPHLLPELAHHLATHVPEDCEFVFVNQYGEPIKRSSFRSVWLRARREAGVPHLRFHDLRHTGNTFAAATGASTRELMARMGHSSMRAALIYQHATRDRDAAIAAALSELAQRAAKRDEPPGKPE